MLLGREWCGLLARVETRRERGDGETERRKEGARGGRAAGLLVVAEDDPEEEGRVFSSLLESPVSRFMFAGRVSAASFTIQGGCT